MASTLGPIPYKVPLTTQTGFVSEPWAKWLRALFERVGGLVAPTITEIEEQLNIDGIQAEIAALQSQVAALQLTQGQLGVEPVP